MGRKSDHGIAVTATANGSATGYAMALRGVWGNRLKEVARQKGLRPDRYLEDGIPVMIVRDLLRAGKLNMAYDEVVEFAEALMDYARRLKPTALGTRAKAIAAGEDFREVCKR